MDWLLFVRLDKVNETTLRDYVTTENLVTDSWGSATRVGMLAG